jgi:hypothetical protein
LSRMRSAGGAVKWGIHYMLLRLGGHDQRFDREATALLRTASHLERLFYRKSD